MKEPFFIGWAPIPGPLRGFLAAAAVALVALFALLGYLMAATQPDPGDGAFRWDWGRQEVVGVLTAAPYPVLHVTESDRFAPGTSLLLTGGGKRGAQGRADPLDGQLVRVAGVPLARGDLMGIQLQGGSNGLRAAEGAGGEVPGETPLGRWRLTGEICDGKCYIGAMRPGTGLAHRACANLCLQGGIPPVLVATDEVDGHRFFLLADAEGAPVTEAILDHVGFLIEAEGEVVRIGTLPVFRLDPATLRAAR
ncbi:MAG: hypothetical protein AAFW69_08425 [Pseudomonadota bacterium]